MTEKIQTAQSSEANYTKLVREGLDRHTAYTKAFLNYYNDIYGSGLSEPMTEDDLYSWIESFLSTENGKIFLDSMSHSNDGCPEAAMTFF